MFFFHFCDIIMIAYNDLSYCEQVELEKVKLLVFLPLKNLFNFSHHLGRKTYISPPIADLLDQAHDERASHSGIFLQLLIVQRIM